MKVTKHIEKAIIDTGILSLIMFISSLIVSGFPPSAEILYMNGLSALLFFLVNFKARMGKNLANHSVSKCQTDTKPHMAII